VAILVSYFWGVVIFKQSVGDVVLSLMGLVVLIFGVLIIAFSESIGAHGHKMIFGDFVDRKSEVASLFTDPLSSDKPRSYNTRNDKSNENTTCIAMQSMNTSSEQNNDVALDNSSRSPFFNGILCAFAVGIFGGSILGPSELAPPAEKGFVFLPSFGIGAFCTSVCVLLGTSLWNGNYPQMHTDVAPIRGAFSGIIFNFSQILTLIAIPDIGYAVANPILQCALFFAGIWGIFVFKELEGKPTIVTFFLVDSF
jgi:hypothetical protein